MYLQLLHGPAIINSRLKLTEIRGQLSHKFGSDSVDVFDDSNFQDVIGGLMTMPLLSDSRVVILENPDENWDFSSVKLNDSISLIIWLDHEVDQKKPLFKFVKDNKGQMLLFSEGKEASVFPFLDALGFKDKKAYLEYKKLKQAGYDSQYIITMVFYLLRSLAVDSKKAPPFVKNKNARQRQNFTNIGSLYRSILETDYKIKSGLLEPAQAEFLLINKFLNQ